MERVHVHRGRSGIPLPKSRLPLPSSSLRNSRSSWLPSPSRDRLHADDGLDVSRLRRTTQDPLSARALSNARHGQSENQHDEIDGLQGESLTWSADMTSPSPRSTSAEMDDSQISAPATDTSELVENTSLTEDSLDTLTRLQISSSSRPGSSLSHLSRASSSRRDDVFTADDPMRTRPANADRPQLSRRSSSRLPPSGKSSTASPDSRKKSSEQGHRNLRAPKSPLRDASPTESESANLSTGHDQPTLRRKSSTASHLSVCSNRSRKASPSPAPAPAPHSPSPAKTSKANRESRNPDVPVKTPSTPQQPSTSFSPPTPGVRKTSSTTKKLVPKSPSSTTAAKSESRNPTSAASPGKQASAKSSSALRETIAKAKAAAREAAKQEKARQTAPSFDAPFGLDTDDPFNQGPKGDDAHKLALKERIKAARASGSLNIMGLGLKEIPKEVLKMYELDPDGSFSLSETVDLVKLIAADNEFEGLSDEAFPDVDMQDALSDENFLGAFVFGGLEVLDLHYNSLKSLPTGLRRLSRLHSINFSDNKLDMNAFEVLSQVENLADLKIVRNGLSGSLGSGICRIQKLETLDLSGNALTELPGDLSSLSSLQTLNISNNQISSLPFDAFSKVPLRELHANRSGLRGTLIPSSVRELASLRVLDVSENALEQLTTGHDLALPRLTELSIDMNRIEHLPDISSWQCLNRLSARECKLSEIPTGLAVLANLAFVDLSLNDIRRLDERVGLMAGLVRFLIANNPLTEKKYLTMDTEKLKTDLRARCEAQQKPGDSHASLGDGHDASEAESEDTFFSLASDTRPSSAAAKKSPL